MRKLAARVNCRQDTKLRGVLDLLKEVPDQLIILPPADYAELV